MAEQIPNTQNYYGVTQIKYKEIIKEIQGYYDSQKKPD